MKIFSTVLKLSSGLDFHGKILKGTGYRKNVGRVTVLFLCTASDNGLYLYKVSWKYSGRYQNYRADTILICKNFKGQ